MVMPGAQLQVMPNVIHLRFINNFCHIKHMFDNTIYIRIYRNKIIISHIENKHEIKVTPEKPFTTEHLRISNLSNAEATLKDGFR